MVSTNLNILLIENDKQYAQSLIEGISRIPQTLLSLNVVHYTLLKEALDHFKQGDIDLIILEIELPGLKPLEIIQTVKNQIASTPLITLSSRDTKDIAKKVYKFGVQEHLIKGEFHLKQLSSIIGYAIGITNFEQQTGFYDSTDFSPLTLLNAPDSVEVNVLGISYSEANTKRLHEFFKNKKTHDFHIKASISRDTEEIINLLCTQSIHLILIDLTSQDHDGMQIMRTIRRLKYTQPIIIIIPEGAKNLAKQAFLHGAQDYIYYEIFTDCDHVLTILKTALERHQWLNKLYQANHEQFNDLINNSIESMVVVSQDSIIRCINDAALSLFDVSLTEVMGKPINLSVLKFDEAIYSTGESKKLNMKTINMVSDAKTSCEMTIRNFNLEEHTVVFRASDITWDKNPAYLLAFHDITEIKRVAELKAEIQEKTRIETLKDELIGVISHELRTPLTIIKSAICNLNDGIVGELTDKQQKIVQTTNRSVDRLARMINNLLDISRLESGRTKVSRKELNLKTIIQDVVFSLEEVGKKKNITFTMQIQDNLAAVFGDPDMMTQLLLNLVNNALRYAKSTIVISAQNKKADQEQVKHELISAPDVIQISVIDDGTGIAPKNMKLIFDKFRQVDRPEGGAGYKGTGLGLAICKQIITLHNGRIWAESEFGSGARFHFTIPQYDAHDDFLDAFDVMIKKAQSTDTSISVLIISIENMPDILTHASEKDIAWMMNDISNKIRSKALRTTDFFHFRRDTREFVLVFSDIGSDTIQVISKRITNLSKDIFVPGNKGKIYINLKMGISVYPEDASTSRELIQHALQSMA
jgi:PAS domain S-box-containing protein